MDLKQIEYILKIYEEKNITKAAEKLYITQSALNQQLLKLEKEIGTQLFYRTRTEVTPTNAGLVYVEYGSKILGLKREAYNKINDVAEMEKGHITIGFTPGRGIKIFSEVFPKFHREHSNIKIEPMELSVKEQLKRVEKGEIDIGFVTVGKDFKMNCEYKHIMEEDIMLAVPKGHRLAVEKSFVEVDLSKFKDENFVLMYKSSTMREIVEVIFKKAGFKPKELFETANSNTIVTMIKSGICCGILPYYYIRDNLEFMECYYLKDMPCWNVGVVYRRGGYLSKGARDFIEYTNEFFRSFREKSGHSEE